MALSEVHTRSTAPYSAAVLLIVTYPDGTRILGSGSLVGPNDVLTATHVLYAPDHGGWAADVAVYPGVDFNARDSRFESEPLIPLGSVEWRATGWPTQVFQDDDHTTLTQPEGQYDVALLGISKPIGAHLGWLQLAAAYDSPQNAYQLGYPVEGTGLMLGAARITKSSQFEVYSAVAGQGTDIMGPGSSGGPLYVIDSEGRAQVIGVKTSGSASTSHWSDIGHLLTELEEAIRGNDDLFLAAASLRTMSLGPQFATAAAERFEGSLETDVLVFGGARQNYHITRSDAGLLVANRSALDDVDQVAGIERLQFTDAVLALDVGLGESAGQAYRLYQAAFDRTPDNEGLAYWINDLDAGASIQDVAYGFAASIEFNALYGPSADEAFITGLYANVLGREPDAPGFEYWMESLAAGESASGILVSFSESFENYQNVAPAIQDGIWLV